MKTVIFIVLAIYSLALSAEEAEPEREESALDKRIKIERETRYQPFVLIPHKPNYVLPLTYNTNPNRASFTSSDGKMSHVEVKFQFSIKFPLLDKVIGENSSLQLAYTNQSYWQAYNEEASFPVRETVQEPEVFLLFENDTELLGMVNRLISIGISHQSNGQAGDQSRTWNRLYAEFVLQRDDFYLSFKPWYHGKTEQARKDNPDIDKFYGHSEIRLAYADGENTSSIMLRNYFENPDYGAVELNWSFPMSRRVKWFFQYFNGYGENLIDYNVRTNRFGIGFAFTDWL